MVYCSAVDCKSNSSRRKEVIYIYILVFMVFRAIVILKGNAKRTKTSNFTKRRV